MLNYEQAVEYMQDQRALARRDRQREIEWELRQFRAFLKSHGFNPRDYIIREMCETCDGTGAQALHGYDVTDMVREDPDFAEDYFGGKYDTQCEDCKGEKIVEYVDPAEVPRPIWKAFRKLINAGYSFEQRED